MYAIELTYIYLSFIQIFDHDQIRWLWPESGLVLFGLVMASWLALQCIEWNSKHFRKRWPKEVDQSWTFENRTSSQKQTHQNLTAMTWKYSHWWMTTSPLTSSPVYSIPYHGADIAENERKQQK